MNRIYMQVPHVEDHDCDLFVFDSFDAALAYIRNEMAEGEEFMLTNFITESYVESDYTHVSLRERSNG